MLFHSRPSLALGHQSEPFQRETLKAFIFSAIAWSLPITIALDIPDSVDDLNEFCDATLQTSLFVHAAPRNPYQIVKSNSQNSIHSLDHSLSRNSNQKTRIVFVSIARETHRGSEGDGGWQARKRGQQVFVKSRSAFRTCFEVALVRALLIDAHQNYINPPSLRLSAFPSFLCSGLYCCQ